MDTDLHLQCGVRILVSTTVPVLVSIMADRITVDITIIGDWFYNKG